MLTEAAVMVQPCPDRTLGEKSLKVHKATMIADAPCVAASGVPPGRDVCAVYRGVTCVRLSRGSPSAL
jgi:hypothetical protein